MAVKNSTILDQIWLQGTNDYQQRVPRATQEGVTEVAKFLFDPMNRRYYNEFIDTLVNRIGLTVVRQMSWKNPLAIFKKNPITMGTTIQEIGNRLLRAHGYDIEESNLFDVNRPESAVAYHSVNREDRYDISINEVELRKAFTVEGGLNNYIASLMDLPTTSDQYDEYQIMKQLIAEYDQNDGGFYKVHVDDVTDENSAKALIRQIRAITGKMSFLSSMYNKAKVPVFAKPENLVIFTTPEVVADIDVNVLAAAFNTSYAKLQSRVILLDEMPLPGVKAILASEDWIVAGDYLLQTDSFYNPKNLTTNYYLHHWGIYSTSPFMPVVAFTTGEATTPATVTMKPAELALYITNDADETVEGGAVYDGSTYTIYPDLTGSVDPRNENVDVRPDAVTYEIAATTGGDSPKEVKLNSRTFIDRYGHLKFQKGLAVGTVLSITGTTTYVDPSTGAKSNIAKTVTFTIS